MINKPSVKPSLVAGLETDFGSSIATSIWRKMVNNHTWVENSYPIGSILFFYESITEADGTPKDPPNPDIWQYCNGAVIADPDSPLNGQNTPNMEDLFLKGSDTEQLTGGNATFNMQHSHGGQTGVTDDREDVVADIDTERVTGFPHSHSIDNRWSAAESIIPKHTPLQMYIRYK